MLAGMTEEARSTRKRSERWPTCAVLGVGTALPPHVINQRDAAEVAKTFCCSTDEQARWLSILFRRTTIHTRHLAVLEKSGLPPSFYPPATGNDDHGPTTAQRLQRYSAEAGPLALSAARQALARSGCSPQDITHLVTVSCTGFVAPGVDVSLIQGLELPRTVQRTNIGFMGCHGALNGLQVVRAIIGSHPQARVLLCAVEICSVHFQYGWNPDQVVASALFADGAAALVGGPAADAAAGAWRVRATGSCLLPASEDAMTWRIGNHGFEMTVSPQIPDLIYQHVRPWLEQWLARHRVQLGKVGSWAVHPGGPKILNAIEEVLELPSEALSASREVLAECGNMSSPTVFFILDRLRGQQRALPCVALGFGPGLVIEAALFW